MSKEWLARLLIIFGIVIAIAIPAVGYWQRTQATVVRAHMAETGGWTPENLTVEVGKPLHLRLTSDDVTHGFAIGQSDEPAVDILPGEMTDISLVFDKPGKYTYYCTRWCSVNHWRMRGTIEVTSPMSTTITAGVPLYVKLGLDLDADHSASVLPDQIPSAARGVLLNLEIPDQYLTRDYYQTHTPAELWASLRQESKFGKLTDQQVWDLVAWTWQSNTTPEEIQQGKELYSANCAACHGQNGNGNGVFAAELAGKSVSGNNDSSMGEQTQKPADFTDASKMLSASPAHLQGKIMRGGMGTGMPYWGPIFTEDQLWALVAYLWTFQFNLEVEP